MMTKTLMFLTFCILLSFLAVAIVLFISFAIEDHKKNKRIEYPPKKKKGGKQK